ncbi:hypothetical protein CEXT_740571 [Caerostris extrusa]|uniref:Ycf15 n=1 Tax=Caerostris extrusa TaxID=172846 RepID=A0AAV4YF47_CAEEX|nr:hypothetical protein CEXT_740571 [Caerostris extrusa]
MGLYTVSHLRFEGVALYWTSFRFGSWTENDPGTPPRRFLHPLHCPLRHLIFRTSARNQSIRAVRPKSSGLYVKKPLEFRGGIISRCVVSFLNKQI